MEMAWNQFCAWGGQKALTRQDNARIKTLLDDLKWQTPASWKGKDFIVRWKNGQRMAWDLKGPDDVVHLADDPIIQTEKLLLAFKEQKLAQFSFAICYRWAVDDARPPRKDATMKRSRVAAGLFFLLALGAFVPARRDVEKFLEKLEDDLSKTKRAHDEAWEQIIQDMKRQEERVQPFWHMFEAKVWKGESKLRSAAGELDKAASK